MKGKSTYVAFVDFHKAFDYVDRCLLYEVLHRKCAKGKLFKAIQCIYISVQDCVRTSQGYTDTFSCPVGLLQGCKPHIICYVY